MSEINFEIQNLQRRYDMCTDFNSKCILEKEYYDLTNRSIKEDIIPECYECLIDDWLCTVCGERMGPCNPRQLCCKWYCPMSPD